MIKIFLIIFSLSLYTYAGLMDTVGDIVKSTLSDEEKEEVTVTTVGTVETVTYTKEKDDSILDNVIDSVQKTMGMKEDIPNKTSLLDDTLDVMKEVTGLESKKEDKRYFDDGIMGNIAEMISLEKGETLGLPSVFGFNKKKEKKVFGSTILGDTFLGDIKETSNSFYRGFKNTGESTEFMSGVMYKSSKVYNGMFEMFDDSMFNIFEDQEEREASIFDVVDKGNSVLDIFE